MTRLAATLGTDVRVQFRNGFYLATAFVVACSVVLLRWLPPEVAALLLPVVVLENIVVNTFYFVSALLLLERDEGTFAAQSVTPLRTDEYLASKVLTLTALSLVESLLIATAVAGLDGRLVVMSLGIGLAAVLFCLSGVALIVNYESINEFIMPSVLYTAVLSLPVLGYFGIGAREWYLPHPILGPLELMRMHAPYTPGWLVYAIGYPLLWIIPVSFWSRRALRRLRSR
ncbi:MAG: ABC transporter permease [Acidobacteria bacterium]|nr:ABC transporter permease [Acidobacteriota bacterium]MCA1649794.1 ABC transporter permease [Acidobacteriota bacterium]